MNKIKHFFIGLLTTFFGLLIVVVCAIGMGLLYNAVGGLWAITIIILVASVGVGIAFAIAEEML